MIQLSKRWKMVSAVGYGVLFALALTGLVRFGYMLSGREMPESLAGNLFLITSIVAGSLSAFLYGRFLKATEAQTATSTDANWRE